MIIFIITCLILFLVSFYNEGSKFKNKNTITSLMKVNEEEDNDGDVKCLNPPDVSSPSSSSCSSNDSSLDKSRAAAKCRRERKHRKSSEEVSRSSISDKQSHQNSLSKSPLDTIGRHLQELDKDIYDLSREASKLEIQQLSIFKVGDSDINLLNSTNKVNGTALNRAGCPKPFVRPPMNLPSIGTDSDHIYESIPDNTESDEQEEPIYCLPYEPGKTGRRISTKCSVLQTNILNKNQSNLLSPSQHQVQCSLNNSGQKTDPRGTRSSKSSSSSAETGSRGNSKGSSDRKRSSFREAKSRSSDRDGSKDSKKSVEQWVEENANISVGCNCKEENRDSSSAYNTGDSTGSNHQVSQHTTRETVQSVIIRSVSTQHGKQHRQ